MVSQNKAETSHLLGIDFGKSKIGLAISDPETRIAFAYTTIKNDRNFFLELGKIIKNQGVGKIIIGIPGYAQNDSGEIEAKKIGERIKEAFGLDIFYQDEMFTTKMAQANLHASGVKNAGKADDAEAARIILQEYLDNN